MEIFFGSPEVLWAPDAKTVSVGSLFHPCSQKEISEAETHTSWSARTVPVLAFHTTLQLILWAQEEGQPTSLENQSTGKREHQINYGLNKHNLNKDNLPAKGFIFECLNLLPKFILINCPGSQQCDRPLTNRLPAITQVLFIIIIFQIIWSQ